MSTFGPGSCMQAQLADVTGPGDQYWKVQGVDRWQRIADCSNVMNETTTYHRLNCENAILLESTEVFDNPVDPEQLAKFLSDGGHELVFAASGRTIVGFASGTMLLHPDKVPAFFVNEVDVAPEWRRQGIATALCRKLIGIARDLGCQGIWLATEEDNVAARALYRRLDARETGAIVVYDWDGAMDA